MTREEMETRRMRAADILKGGFKQSDVAKTFRVSRTTISRWACAAKAGKDMHSRKAPGRPKRLTTEQEAALKFGWETRPHWTTEEFRDAIQTWTGVHYDADHVGRIIRRLGLRGKRQYVTKDELADMGVSPV